MGLKYENKSSPQIIDFQRMTVSSIASAASQPPKGGASTRKKH